MFHIWWGMLFVAAHFSLFLLCYRLFGRQGIFAWIGFATVIANIQVLKTIEVLGIITTLGNTVYTTIYMATDLLNEKYGPRQAKKAVWFGFFTLIASTIIMQLALRFDPQETDFAQESLETIFGLLPRIAAGSLLAYAVSQLIDVKLFTWIKSRYPHRKQLWMRTIGSTGVSQFLDTLVFCTIAFAGVYTMDVWLQILLTTYGFKLLISVVSTPVLYAARRMEPKEETDT
ncbi:queuosine precursor transporter [Marinicrinis sediminis]|uniref:Probable queuosine precursor transporter n=1 Tax=Marinicrinis sediminis TaxID=1652465 RepID=A0ABW5RD55_9BACL